MIYERMKLRTQRANQHILGYFAKLVEYFIQL